MASHRGTPSAPSRSISLRTARCSQTPQVDQSQFEQPFDGPFALQPAEFPQQDRGQSFFVAGRHASGSWVKVQRTEAACGS